jgi:hypothetical protein
MKPGHLKQTHSRIGFRRSLPMPELIPNKRFVSDLEKLKKDKLLLKKIAKCLKFLEENPFHPGLRIERIANDPTA